MDITLAVSSTDMSYTKMNKGTSSTIYLYCAGPVRFIYSDLNLLNLPVHHDKMCVIHGKEKSKEKYNLTVNSSITFLLEWRFAPYPDKSSW